DVLFDVLHPQPGPSIVREGAAHDGDGGTVRNGHTDPAVAVGADVVEDRIARRVQAQAAERVVADVTVVQRDGADVPDSKASERTAGELRFGDVGRVAGGCHDVVAQEPE